MVPSDPLKKIFEDLEKYYLNKPKRIMSEDIAIYDNLGLGSNVLKESKDENIFILDNDQFGLNPIDLNYLKTSPGLLSEVNKTPTLNDNIKATEEMIMTPYKFESQIKLKVHPNDYFNSGVNVAKEGAFHPIVPEFEEEPKEDKLPIKTKNIKSFSVKYVKNSKYDEVKKLINDHSDDNQFQKFMSGATLSYTPYGHTYGALLAVSDLVTRNEVINLLIDSHNLNNFLNEGELISKIKNILYNVEKYNIKQNIKVEKVIPPNQNFFDLLWSYDGFAYKNLPGSAANMIETICLNSPNLMHLIYNYDLDQDINSYLAVNPRIWERLISIRSGEKIIRIDHAYDFDNSIWNNFII